MTGPLIYLTLALAFLILARPVAWCLTAWTGIPRRTT